MSEANEIGKVASFDQMEAGFRDMAKMLVFYRDQLVTSGMRDFEAFDLIRDFQWLQWCKAMWPNLPPGRRSDVE